MLPGWLSLVAVLLVLALIPVGVKWLQRRLVSGDVAGSVVRSKVVSVVAVGPRQHVVTVEVGSAQEVVQLVLGVTPQSISCLHQLATPAGEPEMPVAPVAGSVISAR